MPTLRSVPALFAGLLLAPACVSAHPWPYWESPGSFVSVQVEVDGLRAPLYPAPDGSGRFYLEAREGARYAVSLSNRTGERLGVHMTVDGLNVISGRQEAGRWGRPPGDPGRMYILDPWDSTTVRGWRTSLSDVRRFTFVDERSSYAARSGKANSKMGWIEVAVYRERRRAYLPRPLPLDDRWRAPREDEPWDRSEEAAPSGTPAPPAMAAPGPEAGRDALERAPESMAPLDRTDRRSYPGTGWGPRADDPASVVEFDPEPTPTERIALRYEYRSALRALGILPRSYRDRDRLSERDRGGDGFAPPPRW